MITYKINKEKGVVVAFFAQTGLTAKEVWEENLSNMLYKMDVPGRFYNIVEDIVNKVLKERVVVGRAKLMEGDTFDEEVGKSIAREDLFKRYRIAELYAKTLFINEVCKELDVIKAKLRRWCTIYIRANDDVIYVKQPLNFNIFKIGKNRYALKIVYATDYEDRGELTESTLDDVSKDAIGIILKSIESSDNLETLSINISKRSNLQLWRVS